MHLMVRPLGGRLAAVAFALEGAVNAPLELLRLEDRWFDVPVQRVLEDPGAWARFSRGWLGQNGVVWSADPAQTGWARVWEIERDRCLRALLLRAMQPWAGRCLFAIPDAAGAGLTDCALHSAARGAVLAQAAFRALGLGKLRG